MAGAETSSSEMLSRLTTEERELLTFKSDGTGKDYISKFISGAYKDDMDTVQFYVLQGYSANLQDANGNTPLMAAAYNGHISVVRYLLSHGADVNFQNNNGVTAIMYAVAQKRIDAVQYMMAFEPDLGLKNTAGLTALDIAKKMDYNEVIELLEGEAGTR